MNNERYCFGPDGHDKKKVDLKERDFVAAPAEGKKEKRKKRRERYGTRSDVFFFSFFFFLVDVVVGKEKIDNENKDAGGLKYMEKPLPLSSNVALPHALLSFVAVGLFVGCLVVF